MIELVGAAVVLGIGGSLHCAGMCGPLALAVGARTPHLLAAYHAARLLSYGAVGLTIGLIGARVGALTGRPFQVGLSWGLATLLVIVTLWPKIAPSGGRFSAWAQSVQRQAMSLRPLQRAIGMGVLTPMLPCGMLYAAFLLALSADRALEGAVVLGVFGLASAPAVVVGHAAFSRLTGRLSPTGQRRARQLMTISAALILFGRGWLQLHGDASCH